MSELIGFDRPLRRDWLDFLAATIGSGVDGQEALLATRELVAQSVSNPGNVHGSGGKTMTILRRIWVTVPVERAPLRDRAAAAVAAGRPDDRLAIQWALCELAYPFYLDTASTVGRALHVQETVTLEMVRGRLAERWGSRGSLPQAIQRILKMWEKWGVLCPGPNRGEYGAPRVSRVQPPAAAIVAEARVRATVAGSLDVDSLQRAADLFPFELPDVRDAVRGNPGLMLVRQGGQGWVIRAT
jgi:hypothetical protein